MLDWCQQTNRRWRRAYEEQRNRNAMYRWTTDCRCYQRTFSWTPFCLDEAPFDRWANSRPPSHSCQLWMRGKRTDSSIGQERAATERYRFRIEKPPWTSLVWPPYLRPVWLYNRQYIQSDYPCIWPERFEKSTKARKEKLDERICDHFL